MSARIPVAWKKTRQAGRNLGNLLKGGHDRKKATQEVKAALMTRRQVKQLDEAL